MATRDDKRARRMKRMKERASRHELRAALLDALADGEEHGTRDLQARLPEGIAPSVVAYHLRVLVGAELAERGGGFYRRA